MESPAEARYSPDDGLTLAQLLGMFRRVAGMTQEELAERAGISSRTIQSVESGASRSLQGATARLLADALALGSRDRERFLAAAVRRRVAGRAPFAGPVHVPIIGREDEIASIERRLAAGDRLITLFGPGGVGKTRVAHAVAERRHALWPGSVSWVSLETVSDPDGVLPALAHAMDISETGAQKLADLIAERLQTPRRLLVLDNFEHLAAAASDVRALLAAAPELVILVTSREALRLDGERILLLEPLPLPGRDDGADTLAANPAVALFMRCFATAAPALARNADLPAVSADLSLAAGIVRLLDGLPLAIELAAAQGATLPLATIGELLETSGLAVLSRGRRDAHGRFATMDAAVSWSVDLLAADAQRLFRLIGVFRGGCTLEAFGGVSREAGAPGLLAALPRVAESQLIQPSRQSLHGRLHMLEPVRLVAVDRLRASGEEDDARRAHAAWFHRWAQEQARLVNGPDPLPSLDALEADLPNIRVAIDTSCDPTVGDPRDALATAGALCQFWEVRGYYLEGRAALAQAIAAAGPNPPPSTELMDALYASGYLAYLQSDVRAVDEAIAHMRPLAERDGTPEYAVRVLALELLRGDAARRPPQELTPLARSAYAMMEDQPREMSWQQSLIILANLLVQSGDSDGALPLLRAYHDWATERSSLLHIMSANDWLAFALLRPGQEEESRALFADNLATNVRLGLIGMMLNSLMGYALAITGPNASRDRLERGALLFGALDRLIALYAYPIGERDVAAMAQSRGRIAAALGEPRLAGLLADGARRSLHELADLVTR